MSEQRFWFSFLFRKPSMLSDQLVLFLTFIYVFNMLAMPGATRANQPAGARARTRALRVGSGLHAEHVKRVQNFLSINYLSQLHAQTVVRGWHAEPIPHSDEKGIYLTPTVAQSGAVVPLAIHEWHHRKFYVTSDTFETPGLRCQCRFERLVCDAGHAEFFLTARERHAQNSI